jgi:hypothetical protein
MILKRLFIAFQKLKILISFNSLKNFTTNLLAIKIRIKVHTNLLNLMWTIIKLEHPYLVFLF